MRIALKNRGKPFICDVPANMLKRSKEFSKGARMLYGTMRGLANGKTGELAIRNNPLNWKFIASEAEIGRDLWQRFLRELRASGYVTCVRERVEHYRGGRKRNVLGRARYFVHKQPKINEKQRLLLMPDSPTVEKSGRQFSSETPHRSEKGASPLNGERIRTRGTRTQSSSSSPEIADDDSHGNAMESKANPFLSEEDQALLCRIRKRLRERHEPLYRQFREHIEDDDFLMAGIELIDVRGKELILNPLTYFTMSFVEIFNTARPGEGIDDDFSVLVAEARRRHERREKYIGQLRPLSAESEERRQQFNRSMEGKVHWSGGNDRDKTST